MNRCITPLFWMKRTSTTKGCLRMCHKYLRICVICEIQSFKIMSIGCHPHMVSSIVVGIGKFQRMFVNVGSQYI